ncbi:MAG: hypothetical protein AAB221_14135 [Bacteroidota bacterium]
MSKDEFLQNHPNKDQPVTVGAMVEAFDQVLVPRIKEVATSTVQEAFDEVLLPAIDEMMKRNNAQQENRMRDYIDRKFYDQIGEFSKRLDAKAEKEKQFKGKVIDLFRRHNMGTPEEIAFMEGLAQ